MFIEELDKNLISELFLIDDSSKFSIHTLIENLYTFSLKLGGLLPKPMLLIKIIKHLLRVDIKLILLDNDNLYSCRDNSVVPYLIKYIFPNRGITLFQNSIRFDYDLRILSSELMDLGVDTKKLKGIIFYCWTLDCATRLQKYFGNNNTFIIDRSYRFNYFSSKVSRPIDRAEKKYDALFISSYMGICEDRLPTIRKYLNANLTEDAFNKSHDKSSKIFLEVCRERKLAIGVVCRNEHPDEEKSFYLSLGFHASELIKIGNASSRFDSYRAIERSNTIVGFSSSLLVEAENFMQKKVIAFDIDDEHVFTPPTIDVSSIINITNEHEAKLKLYRDIAP